MFHLLEIRISLREGEDGVGVGKKNKKKREVGGFALLMYCLK
jgi:hypothetical protein